MNSHLGLVSLGLAMLSMPATAATRYVAMNGNDLGNCSMAVAPCETINYAVGQATRGDVVEVASGTYRETVGGGRAITIKGTGPEPSVIDAHGNHRAISHVAAGRTLILENLRLTGGVASAGGAIYIGPRSHVIVRSSVIDNNEAGVGGGIFITGGSLELSNSTIHNNRATGSGNGYGGGIYATDEFYFERQYRNDVRIRSSFITGNSSVYFGGGIGTDGGYLEIESSTISGNTTAWGNGGGISARGVARIVASRIVSNTAVNGHGGGVWTGLDFLADTAAPSLEVVCSDVTIHDSEILGNTAGTGGGVSASGGATVTATIIGRNEAGAGGGASSGSGWSSPIPVCRLSLAGSKLDGNRAEWGGGIYAGFAQNEYHVVLDGSTVSDNIAHVVGGGISSWAKTFIRDSLIVGNHAPRFGGVQIRHAAAPSAPSALLLDQSTISRNHADEFPAMGIDTESAIIRNATIADNRAEAGNAIAVQFALWQPLTVSMQGTIIANNFRTTPGGNVPIPACEQWMPGGLVSEGYNLVDDATCQLSGPGDLHGTTAVPLDAGLAPLQDNGGLTLTHALRSWSPAIDAGNVTGCQDSSGMPLQWDQRGSGFARAQDGNGDGHARCDIGAFEH
jgi:hypothetical protein